MSYRPNWNDRRLVRFTWRHRAANVFTHCSSEFGSRWSEIAKHHKLLARASFCKSPLPVGGHPHIASEILIAEFLDFSPGQAARQLGE